MTDVLRFTLTHKNHPFLQDAISATEAWGEFAIRINNELLLRTEWNLEAFIDWYLETREQRFSTSLPEVYADENLAQALNRTMEAIGTADDETADQLHTVQYEFRTIHSLAFAFRGSTIPDVIIGLNRRQGEISFHTSQAASEYHFRESSWLKEGSWAYPFDIPDFEAYMDQHLKDFLREWLTRTNNPHAIAQAHRLLDAF